MAAIKLPDSISDISGLQAALDEKAAGSHSHDGTYAAASHSHSIGNVTGLQASLDSKAVSASLSPVATSGAYSDLNGKPTIGTSAALDAPASGNAASGEVVKGSDTRLTDSRTPTTHMHAQSDVTSLVTDLAGKISSSRQVAAANGLSGGGDLSANRTLSVDQGFAFTWTAAHVWGSGLARMTSPRITTAIADANGNAIVSFNPQASAANSLQVTNGVAGNPAVVDLGTAGSSSNRNLQLSPGGFGYLVFNGSIRNVNTFVYCARFDMLSGTANDMLQWGINGNFSAGSYGGVARRGTIFSSRNTLTGTGTIEFDLWNGNHQRFTFGAGNVTQTVSNPQAGAVYVFELIQDGVGGRTITWASAVKWTSGTAPILSAGANKRDVFVFISDGTNLYHVSTALDVR